MKYGGTIPTRLALQIYEINDGRMPENSLVM